jgi:UDP-N-acetylglucosamine--N-acetylmuramyl-(pentapeptide) pyrophosphoryl-undecaprenol N-acetylglucosamine transferase
MTEMMNVADLLICRIGAMTITEISIVGKPAIFIPLPSKMANRQEDNARVLEKIGAAKIILNDEINADALKNQIDSIIENGLELIKMGKRAESLAPCDVENKIYTEICNVTFKK